MRNEKRDCLKDMPFSGKMIVIYVICVIVPMLILSVFYYSISTRKINTQNAEDLENSVLNAKNSVQTVIDRASLVSDLIYYDDDIYNRLALSEGGGNSRILSAEALDEKILSYVIADTLESIEIYSNNDYLYRSEVLKKISDAENEEWLNDFMAADKNANVITYYDDSTKQYRISMVRKMNKNKYDGSLNILKINLSLTDIAAALYPYSERNNLYLVNGDTVIVTRKYSASLTELEYKAGDTISGDYNIIIKELDFPEGYKIAAYYRPELLPSLFGAETIVFIALIFFILFLSTIVILIITKSHATKLDRLTECAVKIQNGVFETVDDKGMGRDEIGTLTRGINDAIVKINSLINQVYKEQIKNAEIEREQYKVKLSSLQGQVNPHFMFNIFEVMRMKALKKRDKELSDILKEISRMFRLLITWKEDMITLDEEMVFVKAFTDVQSYSMDDEVEADISVDDSARDCCIPKMSVQIFVENAFLHGLESISENKRFSLKAYVSDGNLCVEICDNGEGFSEEFVNAINSGRIADYAENHGVGIKNVITRLGLYFDNEFTINVSSVPYEMTRIRLTVPARYRQGIEPHTPCI